MDRPLRGGPLVQMALESFPLRAACVAAVETRPEYRLKLASHVWQHCWRLCGLPKFRIGSLCFTLAWVPFLITDVHVEKGVTKPPRILASAVGVIFDSERSERSRFDSEMPQGVGSCLAHLLPNSLAFECVLRNEPDRLEKFSEDVLRPKVNDKISVVHYAAALGALDCLRILIRRLAIAIDSRLLFCCDARFPFGDRPEVLNWLLEQGNLAFDERSEGLQSVLDSAGHYGVDWMISFVISHFGDCGLNWDSALRSASRRGHIDCLRLLLEHGGADVNSVEYYATPLGLAGANGHVDCARLLVEHGADADLVVSQMAARWRGFL